MTTPSVDDFAVSVEFTVKELNALLNMMNTPMQVPTTTWAAFINLIQQQAGPQVQQAQDSLAAVAKANNEPKATT
jgi:hypothetical protein